MALNLKQNVVSLIAGVVIGLIICNPVFVDYMGAEGISSWH